MRQLYSAAVTGGRSIWPPTDFLAQPLAVMAPTPTARDEAARHGADRPAHPDGSIDVNDPDGDGQDGRRGMDDRRPALLLDAGLEAEGGLTNRMPTRTVCDQNTNFWPALYLPSSGR